jgi:hypothetical protein
MKKSTNELAHLSEYFSLKLNRESIFSFKMNKAER